MKFFSLWLITLTGTCLKISCSVVYLRNMDRFIEAINHTEDLNPGLRPLALVRSLRRTVGYEDVLTRHFLGQTHEKNDLSILEPRGRNSTDDIVLNAELSGYFDKAIHHFVTDTGEERGVVLTPDGTTVALAPLLIGIETGLKAKEENTSPEGLFVLTLAKHLGLSFLKSIIPPLLNALVQYGCWDNVTAPVMFTLSGMASLATDALINGGMDGSVLGNHLFGFSDINDKLSRILREYYSQAPEKLEPGSGNSLTSPLRRQNFKDLVTPALLQEKVLEALNLEGMQGDVELERVVKEGVEEFVQRYMECPAIIPRCQWGAEPFRGTPVSLSPPLPFFYVHHTEVPSKPCLTFQECSKDMQSIQHFHQVERGWHDIGYSFVVGSDGYIYEGRGWMTRGAHTRGHNTFGYGVAFIGKYSSTLPSVYSMELMRHHLVTCAVGRGFLQGNYTLYGHRQVVATDCPGDALYSEIRGWEHYKESNPLNTYKWHTGAKHANDGAKGKGEGQGTVERLEKGSSTKWSKMQSWRKALSEDAGDRASAAGKKAENAPKQDKHATSRKNPFRRALSEPPGSLLSSVLSPSSSSSSSQPNAEASGSNTQDTAQKGKLRKYLDTVSQKFKRPRLQSRNSTPIIEHDPGKLEVESEATGTVRLSWAPPQDVPVWDINSCILQDGQIIIPREEEPVMRTRNRASSCLSSTSLQNLAESHTNLECSPDHVAPLSGPKLKGQDGGVRAMIKRRFQSGAMRKSNPQLDIAGLSSGGRHFGSKESLSVPVSAAENLDLSTDQSTVIRPVHSSILGEKYCFEVINSKSNHCFGCSSAAERDRWIENLRRAAQPNKDNCERMENSLSLWVNEAKDLPPKRRYYCELHLDGTLFARTSSRATGKSSQRSSVVSDGNAGAAGSGPGGSGSAGGCQLFWGELFELDNLPPVSQLTLHLFRDEDPKKKRHSKDEFSLHPLGSVALTLADIQGRAFQEKWYPIVPYKPPGSAGVKDQLGTQASLRVKARFQNLQVLPIERYKEFAEFVTVNYVDMCSSLEPLLNVREREELAGALVHVLQSIGKAKEFLIDLGSAEVQRLEEKEALIFRENTLATKAIDEYMKLVGQKYLIDTLGDFIAQLYASTKSCEVDPRKCQASELPVNQKNLKETCEEVVQRITEMQSSFPVELNEIFSSWVSDCESRGRAEIGHRLISASLFLRFLCPAILSPSLFGLTQPYPEPNTLRTLTLTAKVIQNLANSTLFGEKEEYMFFMNDFLEEHWEHMSSFLQRVSNPDSELDMARFDGYVDLPLRLAVLHSLLVDIIVPMKQDTIDNLQPLPSILNRITDCLGADAPRITVSSIGQPKPTYVPPKDLGKYSPLHNSMQQLPMDNKSTPARQKKKVERSLSVPNRRLVQNRPHMKRQISNEELQTQEEDLEQKQDVSPAMDISSPRNRQAQPAPVAWIKENNDKEPNQMKPENEQINILDRHAQELSELRLGVEQVTERELEMAKRLEDFIAQSQEQNAQLQAEVHELRNLLAIREEQLASATFRLGVIEEEREEDERKLSIAMAAAERMNVLEEQFAVFIKDVAAQGGAQ
ncbi:LOW QUALITY PROTEIN: RAS protein activator like-3 [Chanos chanos]|uniref:LOW QUALITY PROTEIN: RAS protein activator like-3 n=1 Tax=Chanos chanos TaxID=29144 RepID=A0A6J2VZT7_CHACN|nr:LOW QUALITY PROTEIN: RAS protein activator like-3-like [Chanos chanos]